MPRWFKSWNMASISPDANETNTKWVEFFCAGVATSFESVRDRAQQASGATDASAFLRRLDPRQRRALELVRDQDAITSRDIERLFTISQRTARHLLRQWTDAGFLVIADPAKKSRKYALADAFRFRHTWRSGRK